MIYDIKLTITHRYDVPSGVGRHLVRMLPRGIDGRQKIVASLLTIDPTPTERSDRTDFFGNRITSIFHDTAHKVLALTLAARIECLPVAKRADVSPDLAGLRRLLDGMRSLTAEAPLHFLGPSARITENADISAYAIEVTKGADSVLAKVHALGAALYRDIAFDAVATTVDSSATEAFQARRGVCQDMSHIMITGLRALGIPAGYVSGFIRTEPPEGMPRLEGADASHAWVRAWCGPETGWAEYDPTNDRFVGTDHIVIGFGRDYADVSPVKGVHLSAGGQTSQQAVTVIPVGETVYGVST
jgi:transglutaminase-like putative cysteine protease